MRAIFIFMLLIPFGLISSCSDDTTTTTGPVDSDGEFKEQMVEFELTGDSDIAGQHTFSNSMFSVDIRTIGYGQLMISYISDGNSDLGLTLQILNNYKGPLNESTYPIMDPEVIEIEQFQIKAATLTVFFNGKNYESIPEEGSVIISKIDEDYFEGSFDVNCLSDQDSETIVNVKGKFIYNDRNSNN